MGAGMKNVELLSFYPAGVRVGNGRCFDRRGMDIMGYLIGSGWIVVQNRKGWRLGCILIFYRFV